ncbi:MAG: efflux RND transporter permease subunit, partial [Polyangiaceae bacterium]
MLRFFIHRPIFAAVCSLLIVLAGGASLPGLPVAQYPQLAPPQVTVTATYLGASAEVVETTVTTPLEEQINGADGMAYMASTSTSEGASQITVTFDVSRDPDLAAVDVQNRVNQAMARLPDEVKQTGVTVTKASTQFVAAMGLYDESGHYDTLFLSNYADVSIVDALKRIHGVGDVRVFGERKYAMRIWLDPARLASRGLTATDVVRALREQNAQVASGELGAPPARAGQSFVLSVRTVGRLSDAAAFDRIVLKTEADGTLVHLGDVGRAELGAEDYSTSLRFNGRPAVGLGVLQLPSANALDVGKAVFAEMRRLSRTFPPGMKYSTGFDTTTFVKDSIADVVFTLGVAIALVILVMFLFLASARATLIPAITIPVSLVGTFALVRLFGFSINTLTMFGIVLATGLVVDDAIVVIENIQRFLHETTLPPREAALAAMREVAGAVVATSLVLIAVF